MKEIQLRLRYRKRTYKLLASYFCVRVAFGLDRDVAAEMFVAAFQKWCNPRLSLS